MPAPHHSGRMPFLPPNQQRQSTEGTATAITANHYWYYCRLSVAELSMGPFCVTLSNPTHPLTDPTQPNPWVNPTHGQLWSVGLLHLKYYSVATAQLQQLVGCSESFTLCHPPCVCFTCVCLSVCLSVRRVLEAGLSCRRFRRCLSRA